MNDPAASAREDETAYGSPGSRTLGWFAALIAVLIVLVLFMHVFAPPIAADDAPPPAHPQSLCIGCHIVTGS